MMINKLQLKKMSVLILLVVIGFALQFGGFLDAEKILLVAREYVDNWWLIVILLLLQLVLFTFALAGSLVFWVVAPLYPPVTAALIVAAGATLGGLGAYLFSRYITEDWIKKIEKSPTYKLLHREDNFFSLFALRIFPGVPHWLINYSSGILKVKISHFIAAAFLGIGIKSYVYADIIYNLTSKASFKDILNVSTILPLVLLSLMTFLGVFIKYKMANKNKGA